MSDQARLRGFISPGPQKGGGWRGGPAAPVPVRGRVHPCVAVPGPPRPDRALHWCPCRHRLPAVVCLGSSVGSSQAKVGKLALLALTTGFVGGAASCARRTRWAMTSAIRASMGIAFPWGARSGTLPHLTSRSREDVTRQLGIVWVDKLAVRHPDERGRSGGTSLATPRPRSSACSSRRSARSGAARSAGHSRDNGRVFLRPHTPIDCAWLSQTRLGHWAS